MRNDLNKRLATLLGWTNIKDLGTALLGKPTWVCDNSRDQVQIPDWEGKWEHCGPLISKYGLLAAADGGYVSASCGIGDFGDAPVAMCAEDGEKALRHAIVSAAIRKLEAAVPA